MMDGPDPKTLFVIARFDEFQLRYSGVLVPELVTVRKYFENADDARGECARLNSLDEGGGSEYAVFDDVPFVGDWSLVEGDRVAANVDWVHLFCVVVVPASLSDWELDDWTSSVTLDSVFADFDDADRTRAVHSVDDVVSYVETGKWYGQ